MGQSNPVGFGYGLVWVGYGFGDFNPSQTHTHKGGLWVTHGSVPKKEIESKTP